MTLDEWTAAIDAELGLGLTDPGGVRDIVLDLARDVAHGVARPAAPLTTYLLGVAVGRGGDPDVAAERIRALVPPPATPRSDPAPS